MTIPDTIHHNLQPSERIRAAVSAMARNDQKEIQTLRATCPKKSYSMTDPAFSDRMERLLQLALGVESDLQRMALDFLIAANMEEHEFVVQAAGEASALEAAWCAFLDEQGIPRDDMAKAGPPRHQAVESLLGLAREEPDEKAVDFILDHLRDSFAA